MPLNVGDLRRDRRDVDADIKVGVLDNDGVEVTEPLHIAYRPSAYTANAELEFNEAGKGDWKSLMGLKFVETLLIEWDLEEFDTLEDGTPLTTTHVVPITQDELAKLPSPFIGQVISAIAGDMGKDAAS